MRCAWQAFINLLPVRMRQTMDKYKDDLQELRLRINTPLEAVTSNGTIWEERIVTVDDLRFCINVATQYSPWAAGTTANGYLSCQGGHRIGICGKAVTNNGIMCGIESPTSLCIRIARDFPGISDNKVPLSGSLLIIGKPGSGKTTLLREIIRVRSDYGPDGISVIDERGEIFPSYQDKLCFYPGKRTDILTGCMKCQGIETALRCMGPGTIAVDEITATEDCNALIKAAWCGVDLIATAHAGCKSDLLNRSVYHNIVHSHIFDYLLIMHSDKSWHLERMDT